MRIRIVVSIMLLSAAYGQTVKGAGEIRGAVVDGVSSQPVPGAHLMGIRVRAELNVQTAIPYRAVADARGNFTMNNVEDGTYQICAEAMGGYLDPCSWGIPVSVRVASSNSETRISLQRGTLLNVDFADEKGSLERLGGRIVEGLPSVEIVGPDGKRRLLSPVSTNAWRFSELVPPDVPFTLTVRSQLLSLADERGVIINAAAGHQTQIRVPHLVPSTVPRMFNRGRRTLEFRVVFVLDLTEQGMQVVAND